MRGRKFVAATLMTGVLAGCGGGETPEVESRPTTTWQAPNASAPTNDAEANEQLRQSLRESGYRQTTEGTWIGILGGADSRVAALQHNIGFKLMTLLAESEPITTTVNGVTKQIRLSMPSPDAVIAMTYVAKDSDVRSAPVVGNSSGSVTRMFLTQDLRITAAIGAISQEPETMIRDAGVEYCQAMDMSVVDSEFDPSDPPLDYNRRKEAACNSAGILGDIAFIGAGYGAYTPRVEGRSLREPAAHGATIPYPVLSQPLYDRAASALHS